MVAYLIIIFLTLLLLTYLTHKIATFFAYDLPLKTLFLCAFFAYLLGMLIPRIVSYGSHISMLMALLSLFVLSSYVLLRSTGATGVAAEETTDTTPISIQQETPEDAIGPAVQDMSTVCSANQNIEESLNNAVSEKINDVTPLLTNVIEGTTEKDLPATIADISETVSQTKTENLYMDTSSDEFDKPQEESAPVIDKIAETGEEDFPSITDEAASQTEPQDFSATASSDKADKPYEEPSPVIDKIAETVEEDFPAIMDEAASPIETQNLYTIESSDEADKPLEEPSPVIDESEEPMEEKSPPSNIGVDDITTSGGSNQLFTDEGGDLENDIIESEIHDIAYYLDLGFAAKESGDYGVAATAFQKAIYIEPDNPSVLYIVIEICALLKLQGFYDDAIRQMEKGRDLALTLNNEVMAGEFNNAIAYLQILSNILSTKHMQSTPYPALPEDVKLEIDEEFRQWKAQAKNDRI